VFFVANSSFGSFSTFECRSNKNRSKYIEFSPGITRATSQVVQDAIDLKSAGLDIDPAELSEKTGYTLEAGSPKQ
jgi:hypothetical protein